MELNKAMNSLLADEAIAVNGFCLGVSIMSVGWVSVTADRWSSSTLEFVTVEEYAR